MEILKPESLKTSDQLLNWSQGNMSKALGAETPGPGQTGWPLAEKHTLEVSPLLQVSLAGLLN